MDFRKIESLMGGDLIGVLLGVVHVVSLLAGCSESDDETSDDFCSVRLGGTVGLLNSLEVMEVGLKISPRPGFSFSGVIGVVSTGRVILFERIFSRNISVGTPTFLIVSPNGGSLILGEGNFLMTGPSGFGSDCFFSD